MGYQKNRYSPGSCDCCTEDVGRWDVEEAQAIQAQPRQVEIGEHFCLLYGSHVHTYTLHQHKHAHTRSKDKYAIYTDIASYSYKGILCTMHYIYTDKHTNSNANITVIRKHPHTYTEPYMLSWFTLCTQQANIAFSLLSCTDEASDSDGESSPWWASITFREDSFNRTHLKFRVAMQNNSALSCTEAAIKGICGEARWREGLNGNKR